MNRPFTFLPCAAVLAASCLAGLAPRAHADDDPSAEPAASAVQFESDALTFADVLSKAKASGKRVFIELTTPG